MVTCQLWRHMRPFVRITAIMDPPSWIFCQSPPLLQNYRKLILKYTRKINYQKNNQTKNFKTKSSLFRLTCLSKLGCHSNVTCHIKTIPVPLPPPLPRAKMTKVFFLFLRGGGIEASTSCLKATTLSITILFISQLLFHKTATTFFWPES